jgi:hypothetical protein
MLRGKSSSAVKYSNMVCTALTAMTPVSFCAGLIAYRTLGLPIVPIAVLTYLMGCGIQRDVWGRIRRPTMFDVVFFSTFSFMASFLPAITVVWIAIRILGLL